jgi:ribosomal protein L37E
MKDLRKMNPKCVGYKYKTFRNYCSLCGLSFAAKTRKYLINYGDKFVTDVVCSKACRDRAINIHNDLEGALKNEIR